MKIILFNTIAIALTMITLGSDIIESQNINASDLGFTKWAPDLKDEEGGWIITCRILKGAEVIDHRSRAYFNRTQAFKNGWMLMANPSILGVEFEGRILRFGDSATKLPGFIDGTVSLWSPGRSRRVMIVESGIHNSYKIEYAIENLPIEEIEKISGQKRFEGETEFVEAPVRPARRTILASELPEWFKKKEAEQDGAEQPATALESKPEDDSKNQPRAEARPQ